MGEFLQPSSSRSAFPDMADFSAADLVRLSPVMRRRLNEQADFVHPTDPAIRGLSHILWTGAPAHPSAHARNAVFYGDKGDRPQPVRHRHLGRMARGGARVDGPGDRFVHESIIGSLFVGGIAEDQLGNHKAWVPTIEAGAHHRLNTIFIDDRDPTPRASCSRRKVVEGNGHSSPQSWPGLSRPSTSGRLSMLGNGTDRAECFVVIGSSFLDHLPTADVDGRHEGGHDERGWRRNGDRINRRPRRLDLDQHAGAREARDRDQRAGRELPSGNVSLRISTNLSPFAHIGDEHRHGHELPSLPRPLQGLAHQCERWCAPGPRIAGDRLAVEPVRVV